MSVVKLRQTKRDKHRGRKEKGKADEVGAIALSVISCHFNIEIWPNLLLIDLTEI